VFRIARVMSSDFASSVLGSDNRSVTMTFSNDNIDLYQAIQPEQGTIIVGQTEGLAVLKEVKTHPSLSRLCSKSGSVLTGEKGRLTVIKISSESSRNNCDCRPDLIYKQLSSALSDFYDDFESITIIAILNDPERDVIPYTYAISRCFPRFNLKCKSNALKSVNIRFFTNSGTPFGTSDQISNLSVTSDSIRICQSLVDAPPNILNPQTFLSLVKDVTKGIPEISVKVIQGKDLITAGLLGVYNVGKGSETEPLLIHLTLKGTKDTSELAIIGKGVCYDTGGLAIKSREGMCGMKRDMGGAAAMLGAFLSIAKKWIKNSQEIGIPTVHCILPIVENSVSDRSYRNDDVITLHSGLTVEINNTDAEGRVILADAVSYAAKEIPNLSTVIDMATLTGAQGISTGVLHAAVVTDDEVLEQELVEVGKLTGNLCQPLLFCPELHKSLFKSEIADMKNSVSNRGDAQSSAAGWFIYEHLRAACEKRPEGKKEVKWAHIDMASPAYSGERATGFGVALIEQFVLGKEF
jgi:probable aminopeptidase NPEPL1